jgi:hypothetical protein
VPSDIRGRPGVGYFDHCALADAAKIAIAAKQVQTVATIVQARRELFGSPRPTAQGRARATESRHRGYRRRTDRSLPTVPSPLVRGRRAHETGGASASAAERRRRRQIRPPVWQSRNVAGGVVEPLRGNSRTTGESGAAESESTGSLAALSRLCHPGKRRVPKFFLRQTRPDLREAAGLSASARHMGFGIGDVQSAPGLSLRTVVVSGPGRCYGANRCRDSLT